MATQVTGAERERELLEAARRGDQEAFGRLVEPYRGELHAHCYRMLASIQDAEDSLQETLVHAWRGLARFEARSSLRSWLYTIATRASLDVISRRPKRILPIDHGPSAPVHGTLEAPLAESVWLEPYPDDRLGVAGPAVVPEARYELRESVELAFVAALQHLPARQRAVLILRDVLAFSAREVAETLGMTVTSVNSAMQRARRAVDERVPEQTQQATLRELGDDEVRRIVERFIAAWDRDDVSELVSMLTEQAAWSMPPLPTWFRGREAVTGFLLDYPFPLRWRRLPTHANGQPAVMGYLWDEARGCYVAHALDVLTLEGDRIAEVTAFLTPELFPPFALPAELPA